MYYNHSSFTIFPKPEGRFPKRCQRSVFGRSLEPGNDSDSVDNDPSTAPCRLSPRSVPVSTQSTATPQQPRGGHAARAHTVASRRCRRKRSSRCGQGGSKRRGRNPKKLQGHLQLWKSIHSNSQIQRLLEMVLFPCCRGTDRCTLLMYRRDAPSASRGKGKRRRRFFRVSLAGVVVPDGGGQRRGRGFLGQKVCAGKLVARVYCTKEQYERQTAGAIHSFPNPPPCGLCRLKKHARARSASTASGSR